MAASTVPALTDSLLRRDAGSPAVTFYDDASGERVELSVATFTNWVNKTAGLLRDELDADSGDLVLVDLPTHWLGPVWLWAVWTAGLCVTTEQALAAQAAVVVCGPSALSSYSAGGSAPVVALSLRPLGARFAEPLPDGVLDYGAVVLGQPDVFVPPEPVTSASAAWREPGREWTQGELLEHAAATMLVEPGGRLLTDANPCSVEGREALLAPLASGGSVVLVRHPDAAEWPRRYDAERATASWQVTRSGG